MRLQPANQSMSPTMTVRSPMLWWFLPPAAALFYPQAVRCMKVANCCIGRPARLALSAALVLCHFCRWYQRCLCPETAEKKLRIGIGGASSGAPGGGPPSPIRSDRRRLLFAWLPKKPLRVLADPVDDDFGGRSVGCRQAKRRIGRLFTTEPDFAEDGSRHFGAINHFGFPRRASPEPRKCRL